VNTGRYLLRDTSGVPANYRFSAGQISGTSSCKLPKREWTCQMVALTRDFHILASGVPTGFTAIFLAIRYIAQARQVSALLRLSIRHHDSVLFRSIFRSLQLSIFDVIPFAQTKPTKSHGIGSSSSVCPRHPDQLHLNRQTTVAAGGAFRGFAPGSKTQRNVRCRRADIASVFGRPRDRIPSYLSEIPVKFVAPTLLGEWIYLSAESLTVFH
jgi:hypothetical protein